MSSSGKPSSSSNLPVNTSEYEYEYLRYQFDNYFVTLLPDEAKSLPFRFLIREILVVFVFQPILGLLSDPDFWNQRIDEYATKAIREQKMVNKLREALDKQFADDVF